MSIHERRAAIARQYPTWQRRTISEHFTQLAVRHPDRPLLLTDDGQWSYAEMVDWARRLAKGLIAGGLQRGDHVAVVMANYPELVALRLAISFAGGVTVPINTMLKRDEF